jgi:hypothetical protein
MHLVRLLEVLGARRGLGVGGVGLSVEGLGFGV